MPSPVPSVRPRIPADAARVAALLRSVGLPLEGLEGTDGFVYEVEGQLVGHVALERAGDGVVLRSLAVDPGHQGKGIGKALFDAGEAASAGLPSILRTESIEAWALRRGYQAAKACNLPPGVLATSQFAGGVCASAPVFIKEAR